MNRETFKRRLDKRRLDSWLKTVPDKPRIDNNISVAAVKNIINQQPRQVFGCGKMVQRNAVLLSNILIKWWALQASPVVMVKFHCWYSQESLIYLLVCGKQPWSYMSCIKWVIKFYNNSNNISVSLLSLQP